MEPRVFHTLTINFATELNPWGPFDFSPQIEMKCVCLSPGATLRSYLPEGLTQGLSLGSTFADLSKTSGQHFLTYFPSPTFVHLVSI